jgi:catechol 2,3-dioxygenase-like lactoylglutathione lyase family enzyme
MNLHFHAKNTVVDAAPPRITANPQKQERSVMPHIELNMIGLLVEDMDRALAFYRHLSLAVPNIAEGKTRIELRMGEMTFFLDSHLTCWDPDYAPVRPGLASTINHYPSVFEFSLGTEDAVDQKYAELVGRGYEGFRNPHNTSCGMRFALIKDPDGNTILLSGRPFRAAHAALRFSTSALEPPESEDGSSVNTAQAS